MTPIVELDRFAARHLRAWDEVSDASWVIVDGTLVFVDISGFTALSEKLAALGRVGAEELTEVLNRVFGEMLDLAAARGGTLLKYGGDALLLLFEGPDHAVQAASATVEMRAALRKAADIPTSVGRVPLRMSQGVHSGEIHLFRALGSHAELILAGPAASEVAFMEGTAEAGEIVVSDATKALLPPDSAVEKKGEGWILRWRTPRVDPLGSVDPATPGTTDIAPLIPVGLRSFLSAGRPDSEHRQATVAFVKLLGIDGLLDINGPALTAEALGSAIDAITTIADEEEVTFLATDVDLDACKVILVSGVPTTRVDEEGRMLRAVRRIADIETPLGIKIGVNRGDVFSGEVGGTDRSTYTIMGDTVNLAARLMAAAPTGEIYATPAVIDRSRTLYLTSEVAPFHVKGKSAPVRALSIGEEAGTRSLRSAGTPFVGRVDELAALRTAVDDTSGPSGASFTIVGPTGIGKTRLVEEALRDADVPVLEVRAEPYGSANPYRPWRDTVRTLLGVERASQEDMASSLIDGLRSVAPELLPFAPLLGDAAHVEMDPTPETAAIDARFRQDRTADVMIDLLVALHPDGLVVAAEDLHWADAATLNLLHRLAAVALQHRWVILATSRDGAVEGSTEVELGPLGDADVRDLIYRSTEGSPFRSDVVEAIVARAGGSPLFVEELIGIVRDTGDVSSLPTSLDGVVGSQIDSLPPFARRVLRYLSILGRSFRRSIARDLLAAQGIMLDDATRSTLTAFLDDDGPERIEFRHAMVRDVAYEGLSYRLRRELHQSAGELLMGRFRGDEDSIADVLALHFAEAGDAPRAWRFARTAADRNLELFANSEAAAQFERAIAAARQLDDVSPSDLGGVWIELGSVREQLGQFDAALDAYGRASGYVRDQPERLCEVFLKRASAKERAGRYSSALADTSRSRNLAASLDPVVARRHTADALGMAAVVRQAQGRPSDARKAAEAAVQAATEAGNELAMARALSVLDYSLVMLGDLEGATNSERSLEIYRRHGKLNEEGQVAQNLGVYRYWRGDWQGALEGYREGRATLEKVGNVIEAATAGANIGEVLVSQGRFEEAEEPLFSARRTYAASGFDEGIAFVDLLIGRMYGLRGDHARAAEYLQSAIDASRRLRLDDRLLEASIHMADVECRSGSPVDALGILAGAADAAPPEYLDFYSPLYARINGSILASIGESEAAVGALEAGLAVARESGDVYEAALLTLTLERVDAERVSKEDRAEARETLRTLGVRSVSDSSFEI